MRNLIISGAKASFIGGLGVLFFQQYILVPWQEKPVSGTQFPTRFQEAKISKISSSNKIIEGEISKNVIFSESAIQSHAPEATVAKPAIKRKNIIQDNNGTNNSEIILKKQPLTQSDNSSPLSRTGYSSTYLHPRNVFEIGANGWYTYELRSEYKQLITRDNIFVDNNDGTITDKATGLSWIKKPLLKGIGHDEAANYCGNLNYAGYHDWRLPTLKEMLTILQNCANSNGVYLPEGFNGYSWFWTADIRTQEDSWFVNVSKAVRKDNERVYFGPNYDKGFVWPVRGDAIQGR